MGLEFFQTLHTTYRSDDRIYRALKPEQFRCSVSFVMLERIAGPATYLSVLVGECFECSGQLQTALAACM